MKAILLNLGLMLVLLMLLATQFVGMQQNTAIALQLTATTIAPTIRTDDNFLSAKNKDNNMPDNITTPSGLKYQILKAGRACSPGLLALSPPTILGRRHGLRQQSWGC